MENNNKKNNFVLDGRRQVVVLTAVIAMVLVVLVDTSYAWYVVTKTSDKTVGIKAGVLSLEFKDNDSKDIVIADLTPVSDEEGEASVGYSFKITNTGSVSSNYLVYFIDKELDNKEARLEDKYVKYNIEKDGESVKTDFLSSLDNSMLISGKLDSGEESEFVLRLWLDDNMFDRNAAEKVLKKTIKISATQLTEDETTIEEKDDEAEKLETNKTTEEKD